MSKIIVLAGGDSDERDVSLRSGTAVARALTGAGHKIEFLDPRDGLDTLLPKMQAADAVFPALHGKGGEDGALQHYLELHHITYVGSDSQASALTFFKTSCSPFLQDYGILVPETHLVVHDEYQASALIRGPYVLKPNDGGSSVDTFVIRDPDAADGAKIAEAFERHGKLLLQPLVAGKEITVGILGNEALPVIEIIPPSGQEFDYANKYNGATQELCPPQHVDAAAQQAAQALARQVHNLTGCRDMSRTDIIITGSSEQYVLDVNTIPGLTDQSLFPKAAAAAGHTMVDLCETLLQAALNRGGTGDA